VAFHRMGGGGGGLSPQWDGCGGPGVSAGGGEGRRFKEADDDEWRRRQAEIQRQVTSPCPPSAHLFAPFIQTPLSAPSPTPHPLPRPRYSAKVTPPCPPPHLPPSHLPAPARLFPVPFPSPPPPSPQAEIQRQVRPCPPLISIHTLPFSCSFCSLLLVQQSEEAQLLKKRKRELQQQEQKKKDSEARQQRRLRKCAPSRRRYATAQHRVYFEMSQYHRLERGSVATSQCQV